MEARTEIKDEISWGTSKDLIFIIVVCLIAAGVAKLPAMLSIDEEYYYSRNIGFIVFPALSAYFTWKNKLTIKETLLLIGAIAVAIFFINLFPVTESDTLVLSCIHLIFFLWSVLGYAFCTQAKDPLAQRLNYLRYNGDLIVMTTLMLIAGGILTGLTIGLFSLIDLNIKEFYFNNVVIVGLAVAPIIGTYLTQTNPQLVSKVSPVIAKIFSPLVLFMLIIYLIAIVYSGKDPYNDREFLLLFNLLLIGVMAIIFFSVAESSQHRRNRFSMWILFLLSVVTVLVNGLALSAILFRISEWGITPNRSAVLGSNLLMLVNLLLIVVQFYKVLFRNAETDAVGKAISAYLPVYAVWTIIVTFVFPLLFGFR